MHQVSRPAPDGSRRAVVVAALTAALLGGRSRSVPAQTPARSLRILCAAPPGGTPDVIARHYAARLGSALPAGALVDNRPGAAGLIAMAALQQAAADGGTALLGHAGLMTMYPYLYARLPYDPNSDVIAVAPAAETGFGIAVGPAVPAQVRDLADYTRWAQGDPTRATYGTPGNATLPHVLGALLAREAGFTAQHVAYAGGPQAVADLIGGRISSVVLPEGLLRPLHLAGKLRVLATSGPARGSVLPLLPTLAESGYKSLVLREWFGFYMLRGTPAAAVDALAQAVRSAAASPEMAEALGVAGLQPLSSTSTKMVERLGLERAFWRDTLPSLGIRMD